MEARRAEGIVLRTQPVTESSLLVTWFTREAGKLKTLAKGARRPKSPFRGKLDLFYRNELVYWPSRRSDLHLLHECFVENPHKRLRESMETLAAASYVCEMVEVATEREDANPKIFDLLAAVLNELKQGCEPVILIWFELQLLAATGWKPKWEKRTGVRRVLTSLAEASLKAARRVRLSDAQVREARDVLWRFSDVQFGKSPCARRFLQ
jgi:DNA repair protein RecO (recombination protein O)